MLQGVTGALVLISALLAAPWPRRAGRPAARSTTHVSSIITPSSPSLVTIIASRAWAPASAPACLVVAEEIKANRRASVSRRRRATKTFTANQDTDGSRSLRHFVQPMRPSAMRQMLDTGRGGALGRGSVHGETAQNHAVVRAPATRWASATWRRTRAGCRCHQSTRSTQQEKDFRLLARARSGISAEPARHHSRECRVDRRVTRGNEAIHRGGAPAGGRR